MAVLVDSNIFLDIFKPDPVWSGWSVDRLAACAAVDELLINQIVYSEISISSSSLEALNEKLARLSHIRENLPWEAAQMAGRAFVKYKRQGGEKRSPLPDFYIGAHAAVKGHSILTRDPNRYRTYFPLVDIIAPDTHP